MMTKQFGQYLLQKGVISREQLLKALEVQRDRSPVVGEMAVEMGYIGIEDADAINRAQIQKDLPFGKLAVQMDLLSEEQVESIITKQRAERQAISEILVELGCIEQSSAGFHLAEYEMELSAREMGFEFAIDDESERHHINQFLEKSTAIFERILKRELHYSRIIEDADLSKTSSVIYSLVISLQKTEVEIGIAVEQSLCLDIATAIMESPATAMDEISIDCVGEFLNTIMGYLIMEPYYVANRTGIAPPIQMGDAAFKAKPDGYYFEMHSGADAFLLYFSEREM